MFQFAFEGALFTLNVNAPAFAEALFALSPTLRFFTSSVLFDNGAKHNAAGSLHKTLRHLIYIFVDNVNFYYIIENLL